MIKMSLITLFKWISLQYSLEYTDQKGQSFHGIPFRSFVSVIWDFDYSYWKILEYILNKTVYPGRGKVNPLI